MKDSKRREDKERRNVVEKTDEDRSSQE